MDQTPLILSNSQVISSPFGTCKKRRLSECSDSSNTSDGSLLGKKFLDLNLDSSSDNSMRTEESVPVVRPLNIPKPIRVTHIQEEPSSDKAFKSENYIESLFRNKQNPLSGIAKYLTLDVESKIQDLQKLTNTTGSNEKFKISSILTSPLYNALAFPIMKELYASSSQKPSESQESNENKGDSEPFGQKLAYKENYVGKLTKAERQLKVEKFLEKKQRRQWKSIRYTVRKDLANSRKREQGRFVKANNNNNNNNTLSQSALSSKTKDKENAGSQKLKNNSDVTFNSMSLSSSLGKRPGKADLFADSTA